MRGIGKKEIRHFTQEGEKAVGNYTFMRGIGTTGSEFLVAES
jgi:hypothetical protein